MKSSIQADPVLSCREAQAFEAELLKTESDAWAAMTRAGIRLAHAALRDYCELREVPDALRVLALVGKGHNGGDALIACGELLALYPRAKVSVWMLADVEQLKPLTKKAYHQLAGRVTYHVIEKDVRAADLFKLLDQSGEGAGFHLCLDGLMGMAFQPPLRSPMDQVIGAVNAYEAIDMRVAVDLPSGLGDCSAERKFRADFTYATGIAKQPIFEGEASVGRVRYLDLGFFAGAPADLSDTFVLRQSLLSEFRGFRSARVDKRHYGHVFIVGGSRGMPGALLMTVQAAVRSGVGRVTVFAPESLTPSLAAQVPEAMWVPCPESDSGLHTVDTFSKMGPLLGRTTALVTGPGMGQSDEIEALLEAIITKVEQPLLLDADALLPVFNDVIAARSAPTVLTPHVGEFMRLSDCVQDAVSVEGVREFAKATGTITVLKGGTTLLSDGIGAYWNVSGGPVLARGGSGDLLAGLIGGLLARPESDPLKSTAQGILLHGMSADRWARSRGQTFVRTTELLDYLSDVSRGE